VYDTDTPYLITSLGTGGKITDVRYMNLITDGIAGGNNDFIYYSDCDNIYNVAPFGPTNQIDRVDLNTGTTTQLSSNANVAGGFPTSTTRGNIGPGAANVADGLIYFMMHDFHNNAAHLWLIPFNSPATAATQMTPPP